MGNAIEVWHAEHVNFSRLLDILETQVEEFREGASPNFVRMVEIISYLREFGDKFHHPREDVAFECLVKHDPSLRLPINRLLQEHRAITVAGEELEAHLKEVISEALVSRSSVEAAAALYLAYYRHHLSTEEKHILPRAARLLTDADWAAVSAAAPSGSDPLFGKALTETYRELRELIAARSSTGQSRRQLSADG